MKLNEFDYFLPEKLIAQTPIEPRDSSRLLILDKNSWDILSKQFFNILDYLWENDVLVLNKTKVINARLIWKIENSKKDCEIFLNKKIDNYTWDCLVFPWKKLKPWTKVIFDNFNAEIKDFSDNWRTVEFSIGWDEFLKKIEEFWEVPLPPYIKEKLEKKDRYQTIFNETSWSVAAPTAWLHFTENLIRKLEEKWVKIEKVLLHVWLWTFKNVETENIEEHKMHYEYIEIEEETAKRLNLYKKSGKKIISVWTTSIRVLESFSDELWNLSFGQKETNIFIYPWYKWKFVDSLITNFHLPKSTLLMLVSALAWKENIEKAYKYAINSEFRFFSFWDAMRIK